MDLLLVSPPVANIGQAASSISVLTAYLRARGWEVDQWDAGIDAFHHFHSAEHLSLLAAQLSAEGADSSVIEAAERASASIKVAKRSLQDPATLFEPAAMERAFETLDAAGTALSSRRPGRTRHTYRAFEVAGAFRDWASLAATLDDSEANPYLAWTEEHALPRILASRPASVGVSITYLSQVIPALTLVRRLKQRVPEIPVAVGGGYLTALGQTSRAIPRELLPADAVLLHDGEEALSRWLSRVLDRPDHSMEPTSGEPCTSLDTVPSPSWVSDGLDLSRYLVPRYAIPLPLTRGCHWGRCHYCNISAQTSSAYRLRPLDLALSDIRQAMSQTGSNWFDFPVDSFRPDHLHRLAVELIEQRLQIRWAAEVLMHPGLTAEVIHDLARSGCCGLRFGMESASSEVLTAMNKPRPPQLASRILRDCHEAGI
ncbi:MAG: hypothetical protein HY901_26555, partial [Deltaproteobacteria bacterium]|nr:hypothetical protein [Deltaproteobacteria bacterium]